MEKTVNNSTNANKDTFKNTPHVAGADTATAGAGVDTNANMKGGAMGDMKGKVSDVKNAIVDQAAPAVDYLKNNFSNVNEFASGYIQDAGTLVRRYPMYSLLGAVAVGAMIGMAIARPSSNR